MPTGDDTRHGVNLRHDGCVETHRAELRPSAVSGVLRQADHPTLNVPLAGRFAGVDARCVGCGLGYLVDDLRLVAVAVDPGPVLRCAGCGGPVYLVDESEAA